MLNIREKNLDRWLPGYLRHVARQAFAQRASGTRHLLFALCDHYEPLWGKADESTGEARVRRWLEDYPRAFDGFRDADGCTPRHTWFFPGEEYREMYLDSLATLAKRGCGEVELHLHHDNDTAVGLRSKIEAYLKLYDGHGHICRGADDRLRYAFIHGNWSLANGRPDGRYCGVDAELPLLFETGCYADFTFPSVPSDTQSQMVNVVYWPSGDQARRRAYDAGELARVGHYYDDRILIITGPLGFALRPHNHKPRIEYGALQSNDPPSLARVRTWVAQNIHVAGRPEWVFVKVYMHGAVEAEAEAVLGPHGTEFHRALREHFNDGRRWRLHYVTAREMFNIARAAMEGKVGDPGEYRDYVLPPPPIARLG